MVHRIADYPAPLRGTVKRYLHNPLANRIQTDRHLNTGDHTVIKRTELAPQQTFWIDAFVSPCILAVVINKDESGHLTEVLGLHAEEPSFNFMLRCFLESISPPTENSRVFIAGFSDLGNIAALQANTRITIREFGDFGIPLGVEWENEERPRLIDQRNQQIVSDIGLNVFKEDTQNIDMVRRVILGVNETNSLLISTLFTLSPFSPQITHVITEDTGIIVVDHTILP